MEQSLFYIDRPQVAKHRFNNAAFAIRTMIDVCSYAGKDFSFDIGGIKANVKLCRQDRVTTGRMPSRSSLKAALEIEVNTPEGQRIFARVAEDVVFQDHTGHDGFIYFADHGEGVTLDTDGSGFNDRGCIIPNLAFRSSVVFAEQAYRQTVREQQRSVPVRDAS